MHGQTKREHLSEQVFDNLEVEWMGGVRRASVWYSEATGAPSFLINAPEYFMRPDVYGYRDDHERFAFFCRAALALLGRLGPAPDVVHGNDWPCGFAAVWLKAGRPYGGFLSRTRTLFSIHNLAYQGMFDPADLGRLGFKDGDEQNVFLKDRVASALKAGLMTCGRALDRQPPLLVRDTDARARARPRLAFADAAATASSASRTASITTCGTRRPTRTWRRTTRRKTWRASARASSTCCAASGCRRSRNAPSSRASRG